MTGLLRLSCACALAAVCLGSISGGGSSRFEPGQTKASPPSAPSVGGGPSWAGVDAVLTSAIASGVFPGCVAGVLDSHGTVVYASAFGNFTYGLPSPANGGADPPVSVGATLWDMASVTKILGATSAIAALHQAGYLDVDTLVSDASLLGAAYAQNGKGSVRVRDCLLHQAGYPPDPVPAYDDAVFGCPATSAPHPPLTFSCSERIYASLLAQPLAYPTGSAWLYSDLSMITMQYVVGAVVLARGLVSAGDLLPACAGAEPASAPGLARSCAFEAFVRTHIHAPLGMASTRFLPPAADAPAAAPTWNETGYYRDVGVIQGAVSDDNAYALGGIAGHAGVFSTLPDMLAFTAAWAGYGGPSRGGEEDDAASSSSSSAEAAPSSPNYLPFNATTRAFFQTPPNPTFSPRALGWVVQAPTDDYMGCGATFAPQTAYHTGYTGTLLCVDPVSNISTVLLTNRVYPNSTGQEDTIHATRQAFNAAVSAALGAGQ